MNAPTQGAEEWAVGLHLFLSSRLRTPSYAVAVRAHPHLTVPAMVPHTQYLLDGVAWAINDHPDWCPWAWRVAQGYLKETAERYAEVREELAAMRVTAVPHGANLTGRGVRPHREHVYRAHAAVQDVYLAFCLVDLFLKGSVVAVEREAEVRNGIERDLPPMVHDHMPLFAPQGSVWADDAVEDYRGVFLDLLRSWHTLRPALGRRLGEHVRHTITVARAAVEGTAGAEVEGSLQGGLATLLGAAAERTMDHRGASTESAITLTPRGGPRSAEMVERGVRSFLASIFPGRRSAAHRLRCPHCGAVLRDEASRNAHYRCHFFNHNYLKPEQKVVRMTYCSAEDFATHVGDVHGTGYFVHVTEVLEEAYRGGAKGAVRTRTAAEAASDATAVVPSS